MVNILPNNYKITKYFNKHLNYKMVLKLWRQYKYLKSIYKDKRHFNQEIYSFLTSKTFIKYFMCFNLIVAAYTLPKYNYQNYKLSYSRWLSRQIGRVGDISIPEFMRKSLYNFYVKMYSVNSEEILNQDLNSYKTIKDFFIREINVS
jgi:hypothetical protein